MLLCSEPAELLNAKNFSCGPEAGVCAAIGNFDGVHAGHRALIARMRQRAREKGLSNLVVTFWPHPRAVLGQNAGPGLLVSREQKYALLERERVEAVLEIPFTKAVATLDPKAFLEKYLLPLRLRHLVAGYDFSLGKNRSGNVNVLQELGGKMGFSVEQISAVMAGGEIICSSRVRRCLEHGMVHNLPGMREPFHTIDGKVLSCKQGCGLCTALLAAPEMRLPKDGVYAARIRFGEHRYDARICIEKDKPLKAVIARATALCADRLKISLTKRMHGLYIK